MYFISDKCVVGEVNSYCQHLTNALVNFMPHPRGGGTGDLTNRGVKFPTSREKSAVKSPLCPHPHSRGFDNTSRMTKAKRIFHACD